MPVSNPIRFVDLLETDVATDADIAALQAQIDGNNQALISLDAALQNLSGHTHNYAAANHGHSYAATNHNHTLGRWVTIAGRAHYRARVNANTTGGEVSLMDTDSRCKYFQWNGSALYVQVDSTWVGWLSNASDRRLKTNITNRDSEALWAAALDGLLSIPLVEFDWDDPMTDTFDNVHNDLGVIAQDLQSINSELVTTDPGGYLHINVNQCIVQLLAAIKGLNQKVEALEARLTAAGI